MPKTMPEKTTSTPDTEYKELQRLINWTLWCQALLIAIIITVQFIGGSLTLGAKLIDVSAGFLLSVFNAISISIILRQNPFSHPYGTGKLENFAGFAFGIFVIPGGLWILYSAYGTYIKPPETVSLGLATLPILYAVVRSTWVFIMSLRFNQRYMQKSPMSRACVISSRVTFVADLLLLTSVLIGVGISFAHHEGLAVYFDMAISVVLGIYLLYSGIRVLMANFKSLIDLPLPEDDQLKIMHALAAHFEAYENLGNVYTQLSGNTRMVQIELYVKPDTTAETIQLLSDDIENRLKSHFGKLLFHLIPLVMQERGTSARIRQDVSN